MRITISAVLLLLGLALVAAVGAADERVVLATYESNDDKTRCEESEFQYLKADAAVGSGAIRWKVPAETEGARMYTRLDTLDLRPYGILRLRYRIRTPFEGVIWIGLHSEHGALQFPFSDHSEEWRTLEIPIAGMWARMQFDPEKVVWFALTWSWPAALEMDVDQVELIRTDGGWRGAAGGEGQVYRIADFEESGPTSFRPSEGCKAEVVADGDSRVLRLTPQGSYPFLSIAIDNVPEDLRPFRCLKLRARVVEGSGRGLELSMFGGSGTLETDLPRLTEKWQTIEILLPDMQASETFDARDAAGMHLFGFSSGDCVVELDDFELVVGASGWRYSALERLELGLHAFAPMNTVADFERMDAADRVDLRGCEVERVKVRKHRGNPSSGALKVTFPDDGEYSEVILPQVPSDLTDYRILRFLARVDRKSDADVQVRLVSRGGTGPAFFTSDHGSLAFDVIGFGTNWKVYEFLLPEAHRLGDFAPKRVTGLKISRSGPLTLYVDQVELMKGGGGCLNSDQKEMARLFGAEAAPLVKEIGTKRFCIWTDLKKPDRKLGKRLDAIGNHAEKLLSLPSPVRPVEVYLFADKETWAEPLFKQSWTVGQVKAAAGCARAGCLSTYDQDFDAAPFVEVLTRAILQRTVGSGGGAWLQEGVAGYVAARWTKRSPADDYREQVRKRHRQHLPDLFVMPRLYAEGKGNPRLMAAAFVEFLLRGPRSKKTKEALGTLVLLDATAPAYLQAIEKTMGANLEELEQEWLAWLDGE